MTRASSIAGCGSLRHEARAGLLGRLIVALACALVPGSLLFAWEYQPMPGEPGGHGMVVGDFDGDGVREVAVAGVESLPDRADGAAVFAVLDGTGAQARVRAVAKGAFLVADDALWRADGKDGRDRVVTTVWMMEHYQSWLAILTGIPLHAERLIAPPAPHELIRVTAVADVDGDGAQEAVVILKRPDYVFVPAILDLETGAAKWIGDMPTGQVVVAQLDGDPALELVVAGTPGLVIDGATGWQDWSWAGGFGGGLLAGAFGSGGRDAFAAWAEGGLLQVFGGYPYAPVNEIPGQDWDVKRLSVRLDPVGPERIAVMGRQAMQFFDALTGNSVHDPLPGGAGNFLIEDITGDARREVLYGPSAGAMDGCEFPDGAAPGQLDPFAATLRMINLDGGHCRLWLADSGTHAAVVRGPLGGPGTDEVATFSRGDVLSVIDATTGKLRRFRSDLFETLSRPLSRPPRIALARRIGGMPSLILAAQLPMPGLPVMAVDSVSLQVRWRAADSDLGGVAAVSSIDLDGDGADEVIVATARSQLLVLDGETGERLRESVGDAYGYQADMVVFPDGQGGARAVVTADERRQLRLVDLSTMDVLQQSVDVTDIIALRQWGTGADCRLAVLDAAARITLRDCATLAVQGDLQAPAGTVFLHELDSEGTRFLIAAGEHFHELGADGVATQLSGALGPGLARDNAGDVRILPGGQGLEVTAGSDVLVTLQRFGPDPVFADGFE